MKVQTIATARKAKVKIRVRLAFCWSEVARRIIEVMAPEMSTRPLMVSMMLRLI